MAIRISFWTEDRCCTFDKAISNLAGVPDIPNDCTLSPYGWWFNLVQIRGVGAAMVWERLNRKQTVREYGRSIKVAPETGGSKPLTTKMRDQSSARSRDEKTSPHCYYSSAKPSIRVYCELDSTGRLATKPRDGLVTSRVKRSRPCHFGTMIERKRVG